MSVVFFLQMRMNAQNQTEVAVKGVKISQEVLGVRVNTASCYKQTGKLVKVNTLCRLQAQ